MTSRGGFNIVNRLALFMQSLHDLIGCLGVAYTKLNWTMVTHHRKSEQSDAFTASNPSTQSCKIKLFEVSLTMQCVVWRWCLGAGIERIRSHVQWKQSDVQWDYLRGVIFSVPVFKTWRHTQDIAETYNLYPQSQVKLSKRFATMERVLLILSTEGKIAITTTKAQKSTKPILIQVTYQEVNSPDLRVFTRFVNYFWTITLRLSSNKGLVKKITHSCANRNIHIQRTFQNIGCKGHMAWHMASDLA